MKSYLEAKVDQYLLDTRLFQVEEANSANLRSISKIAMVNRIFASVLHAVRVGS